MEVIKAARANDDARALVLMTDMHEALARIEALSRAVVEAQRLILVFLIRQQEQQAKGALVLLGGFVGVGMVIGIVLSFIAAHLMPHPLAVKDKYMAALAKGDLSIR